MIKPAGQWIARALMQLGPSSLRAGVRRRWLRMGRVVEPMTAIMARGIHSVGVVEAEAEATQEAGQGEAIEGVAGGTRRLGVRNGGLQSMYFPHTIWTN